jgi:ABC-type nitrate/sulfonate/bicarbonate transport system permease component
VTDVRTATRSTGYGIIGIAIILVLWQLAAVTSLLGGTVSAPTAVLGVFADHTQRAVIINAAISTAREALQGFVWGFGAAVVLGLLVTIVAPLRPGMDQLATIESAIPFVAMAPVMIAVFSRENVPAAIAAATAFFPLYVAMVNGMDALPPAVADLLTVLGSSRRAGLLRARIPTGLPVVATGMKIGMPLAIVGAVIGEWFGSSKGLGPIMLAAMRSYRMPTMWAAVAATVTIALLLYGVCALIERTVTARFG